MKIVINRCYGGFGVSNAALKRLIELDSRGVEVSSVEEYFGDEERRDKELTGAEDAGDGYLTSKWGGILYKGGRVYSYDRDNRTDTALVKVVEEMGGAASGFCAELKVVEIPDGVAYEVEEYDGREWVAEVHRTWR